MYYIGIDGGGTKTKFSLFDDNGFEIESIVLGSCHFMQVSKEEMIEVLKTGIKGLVKKHSISDYFVSAGMGGYGRDNKIRSEIESVFKLILPKGNFMCFSDAEIAVAGALGSEEGIVIIAGTGSIALSKINNQFKRTGGWGYLIGDEGSAYWIGKRALSLFCKEADERVEKSHLYHLFMEYFKLENDYDLIVAAKDKLLNRTEVASLSKIVYDAACKGDQHAYYLFEEASDEIICLINALNDKKRCYKVALIGGMFQAKSILYPLLIERLDSNLEIIEPKFPPEKGAYLLAFQILNNSK